MSMKKMTFAYSGSTKLHLRNLDLDTPNIPKHILGFHFDYELTKQRIDQYYDEKNQHSGKLEWYKWEACSDLEKEAYHQTIRLLKFQQRWLKEEEEAERMGPTNPNLPESPIMERSDIGLSNNNKRKAAIVTIHSVDTTEVAKKVESPTSKHIKIVMEQENEKVGNSEVGMADSQQWQRWTAEEDERLRQAVAGGVPWSSMPVSLFQGSRSEHSCKMRWKTLQGRKRVSSRDRWTPEEDAIILKYKNQIPKMDDVSWEAFLSLLPRRTRRACLERRHKLLKQQTGIQQAPQKRKVHDQPVVVSSPKLLKVSSSTITTTGANHMKREQVQQNSDSDSDWEI
jgi:Myb-like DNA-binding domain